jgi:hypothetical protein
VGKVHCPASVAAGLGSNLVVRAEDVEGKLFPGFNGDGRARMVMAMTNRTSV